MSENQMSENARQMMRELRELSQALEEERNREAREALTIENIIAGTCNIESDIEYL